MHDRAGGAVGAAGAPTEVLTRAELRRWVDAAVAELALYRGALDRLNVFPVRDADTGSNLHLTLRDAATALADDGDVDGLLRGALLGARGSSGVIVSQWLAGVVPVLTGQGHDGTVPGDDLGRAAVTARALRAGAVAARAAVGAPMDGTVLTVAEALAQAAEEVVAAAADAAGHVGPDLWTAVLAAGARSLEETQEVHPVLRAAGVPDAGGWGLLLVVTGLARVMGPSGALLEVPLPDEHQVVRPTDAGLQHGSPPSGGEFEVMFVEERDRGRVEPTAPTAGSGPDQQSAEGALCALRTRLSDLGDSVAVVSAAQAWQAHVHTDRPVEVLHLPVAAGRTRHQVSVRHLLRQSGVHGDSQPDLGVVVVTRAPGLVPDFARAGAVVLLEGPGRPVETDEVARAVADTGGGEVLVLAAGPVPPAVCEDVAVRARTGLGEVGVVAAVTALLEAASAPGRSPAELVQSAEDALARLVRLGPDGAPADALGIAAAVQAAGGARGVGLVRVLRGRRSGVEAPRHDDALAGTPRDDDALAGAIAHAVREAGGNLCDVVVLDLGGDLPDEVGIEVEPLSGPSAVAGDQEPAGGAG